MTGDARLWLEGKSAMRIFGIDCGSETTGFGVVECEEDDPSALRLIGYGGISPGKKQSLAERLAFVYEELSAQIAAHQPDLIAVEEVFYSVNAKSALKLGHVRGVALLTAAKAGLAVAEYAPLTIKSTVTGYGLAQKEQVQFMVARLLHMDAVPEPADAADALAIAICHIHHAQTWKAQQAQGPVSRKKRVAPRG